MDPYEENLIRVLYERYTAQTVLRSLGNVIQEDGFAQAELRTVARDIPELRISRRIFRFAESI